MGLDRDPGTLDFFEADIVLLHWVRAQGPAHKKGEGRARKARKRKRGRVPLDSLNYEAIAGSVLVLYPHSSFVLFIREGGQEGQPAFSFKHRETFMRK